MSSRGESGSPGVSFSPGFLGGTLPLLTGRTGRGAFFAASAETLAAAALILALGSWPFSAGSGFLPFLSGSTLPLGAGFACALAGGLAAGFAGLGGALTDFFRTAPLAWAGLAAGLAGFLAAGLPLRAVFL